MRLFAAFAVALALAMSGHASAAELPANFNGTWRIANPSDNNCRAADVKGEDAPEGHLKVNPGVVLHYESACRIVAVKPTQPARPETVEARFACTGEGMRWRSREIWHVETIDGKKVIVVTALGQTDNRNARGKKESGRSVITTSIYYPCT
jgi:hypothetical protein